MTEEHGIRPERLKYLVFAGSFSEYRQWALTNGVLNGEALYVAQPTNLTSLKDTEDARYQLISIGTFHLRPDHQELIRTARERFPHKSLEVWEKDEPQ